VVARIASEALIERLADWGVDTVFGLPGDGINGIMEGLRRHQDKVRFVLVHHEEAAAYEQAKKFAQAFLRGQPHEATIATTLFRDQIQQLRS
jgi:thiamine pyrophosphate-dependent acetolactate synthase large subunit-like protein